MACPLGCGAAIHMGRNIAAHKIRQGRGTPQPADSGFPERSVRSGPKSRGGPLARRWGGGAPEGGFGSGAVSLISGCALGTRRAFKADVLPVVDVQSDFFAGCALLCR